MPGTWAPSTAERIPLERASAASSFAGRTHARESGDVAEEDDARARSDGVIEEVEHLRRVFDRAGERDFFHHDAVALGLEIPGMFAAGMLLVGHQDFVAGLHVDAVGDVAVGFGGVAQQSDFVATGSRRMRRAGRGTRSRRRSPRWDSLRDRCSSSLFCRGVAIEDGAQHRRGTGAHRAVVEVDLVFGDEKLSAAVLPSTRLRSCRAANDRAGAEFSRAAQTGCSGRRARRRIRWLRWRGNDGG